MKLGASLAGVVLLLVAPAALAVHGEAFDAYGVATLDGTAYLAAVHWTGYNVQPVYHFRVVIKDLAQNVVADETFAGGYTASGPVFGGTELLVYHGWAGDWNHVDSAHFDITGFQYQQVVGGAPNKALMYYTGNYYGYALQLVVPYAVPVPV